MYNLFFSCLRTSLHDAPIEKKLKVAIEIMDDISSLSWSETTVYSYRKSSDFIVATGNFTWIVGRILNDLEPTMSIKFDKNEKADFYLYRTYWNHPYLVRIIEKIGKVAVPDGWEVKIETHEVKLDTTKSPREVYEKYVEREEFLASLKKEDEVDRAIEKIVKGEEIEI